jgi:hypothetical protein
MNTNDKNTQVVELSDDELMDVDGGAWKKTCTSSQSFARVRTRSGRIVTRQRTHRQCNWNWVD